MNYQRAYFIDTSTVAPAMHRFAESNLTKLAERTALQRLPQKIDTAAAAAAAAVGVAAAAAAGATVATIVLLLLLPLLLLLLRHLSY